MGVKVFDCFTFFNELELLDLRLHELDSVVDHFVLVEATRTHTGLPKRLYYEENKERFAEFRDRIVHVVIDNMPMVPEEIQAAISPQDRRWLDTGYQMGDNWVRERFQRNTMMRALQNVDPDDIIIISDADEIVRPSVLENIRETIVDGSNAVNQMLHSYYMNWKCTNMPWWGSKILKRKFVTNPSEHRFHTPASKGIENGGWHFNFLGGANAVRLKIKSYAHNEFNIPDVMDRVEERLIDCKDALGRLYEYKVVPIDGSYPKYIQEHPEKFEHLMYKEQV
jgi:beta-1,4-mannosyl-glycoprotein beta-1,4-N-acetylglucosaminyltransferase